MVEADFASDYFVVGSDHVWNPSFWGTNTECYSAKRYLLRNVDKLKLVAYAASFGVEQLGTIWLPVFQKELSKFHAISVRETSGVEIAEKACGKQAEVVLDPTLMLPKEKWNQMAADVQKDNYVLTFFLGEVTQRKQEYIEKISHEHRCKIINVTNKKDKYYSCRPEVFLGLIKHAKLVITDSFHATVFSIVFHAPFLSLTREQHNYCKMSSRLETLLGMVNMIERFNNMNIDDPFICTFDNVDSLIEGRRKAIILFLKNALGI